MDNEFLMSAFWSILPISELRGGIPYAHYHDVNWAVAYVLCVGVNLLAFPIVHLFLGIFHERLMKWNFYNNLFEKFVARTRKKLEKSVDKYGFWALMIFVMIPLPVTGAYTGSFGAWVFGMEKKKSLLAVSLGVIIAGVIVTAVVMTGSSLINIFAKKV